MPVRFEDVGFAHHGRAPVLSHLSLSVERGEIVAVVGRSGAGKTTVLKLVNRLLLPTAGTVVVEGRDTRDWDGIGLRRRIGYVIQAVGLFPHMTVEENVTVGPGSNGGPGGARGPVPMSCSTWLACPRTRMPAGALTSCPEDSGSGSAWRVR